MEIASPGIAKYLAGSIGREVAQPTPSQVRKPKLQAFKTQLGKGCF